MEANEAMNRDLILIRGLPAAGKSTFAELLNYLSPFTVGIVAADDYMVNEDGDYDFQAHRLGECHQACQDQVANLMTLDTHVIAVHNTFTTQREMQPYRSLAVKHGYQVTTIIVERNGRTEGKHDVPSLTLNNMTERFSINL